MYINAKLSGCWIMVTRDYSRKGVRVYNFNSLTKRAVSTDDVMAYNHLRYWMLRLVTWKLGHIILFCLWLLIQTLTDTSTDSRGWPIHLQRKHCCMLMISWMVASTRNVVKLRNLCHRHRSTTIKKGFCTIQPWNMVWKNSLSCPRSARSILTVTKS